MDGFNFTDRTRLALQNASGEAAALGHEYVGTEHILLALLNDGDSAAFRILTALGGDIAGIRATIEATVKKGTANTPDGAPLPFTSRVKKVLELAMACARGDSHSQTGTQHLLLGLIREKKGIAAQVLTHAGITDGPATASLASVGLDRN